MVNLPREIIIDILSRLPVKELVRCLCLSKAWNGIIHSRNFIKAHLQCSMKTNSDRTILVQSYPSGFSVPFDDDETFGPCLEIVQPERKYNNSESWQGPGSGPGSASAFVDTFFRSVGLGSPDTKRTTLVDSVHGLVLIQGDENIALWNPSIQKLKKIPSATFGPLPSSYSTWKKIKYGLGYDFANDDYKVVAMFEFVNDDKSSSFQVQIYSLKSNSWKMIQNLPDYGIKPDKNFVFLNGGLSWLIGNKFGKHIIWTLDLVSEKFLQFPIPVNLDGNCELDLIVLGGCLCIYVSFRNRNDAWIMKQYGVENSWTLLYSIVKKSIRAYPFKPLMLTEDGERVLMLDHDDFLFWYDIVRQGFKHLEIRGWPFDVSMPLSYIVPRITICSGSLCLLDGDPVTDLKKGEEIKKPEARKKKSRNLRNPRQGRRNQGT